MSKNNNYLKYITATCYARIKHNGSGTPKYTKPNKLNLL